MISRIFVSKGIQKKIKQNYSSTLYRVMTPNKIEEFKTALNNSDWSELNVATDVNAAYELFINIFLKMYDEKLPITLKRIKTYSKNHKPWVTSAILKLIHHKHSVYKKSLQDKTPKSSQKYKKYKINWSQLSVFAEKNYYVEKFEMAKGNIRKTWLTIKHIVNGPDLSDKNPINKL